MRILILTLTSLFLLCACSEAIEVDPRFDTAYCIDNQTTETLFIQSQLREPTAGVIITDTIPAEAIREFCVNGTMNTPPTTNFTTFSVAYTNGSGTNVIYNTLDDDHWILDAYPGQFYQFTLVISRAMIP